MKESYKKQIQRNDQALYLYELKLQGTLSNIQEMTFNGVTIDATDRSVTSADGK